MLPNPWISQKTCSSFSSLMSVKRCRKEDFAACSTELIRHFCSHQKQSVLVCCKLRPPTNLILYFSNKLTNNIYPQWNRDSIVGVATSFGVRNPTGARNSLFSKTVHTACEAHPIRTGVPSGRGGGGGVHSRVVKLTTHLHLVPRLGMMELYPSCPCMPL